MDNLDITTGRNLKTEKQDEISISPDLEMTVCFWERNKESSHFGLK